jgi:uracil-DNA glycosylase family 4
MTTKAEKLQKLKELIEERDPTPELRSTATQLVFGDGNPEAQIMFVGEAPGKKEDESGKPFVGASGKFLDEMLASVNINRSDVYITNIVKYRPPNNRDPLPEEKEAFWPYLLEQIVIMKPRIVVTLGRHSGEAFIPELKIGQHHGQPNSIWVVLDGKEESIIVLPLYHPAAALYNGSLRQTLLDDFQSVTKILASN